MRMSCVLCFLLLSMPAVAADNRLKQELAKVSAAYAESFDRQDGAGIAALYARGGIHVTPAGPRTDIAQFFETAFKSGLNHEDLTVNELGLWELTRPSQWANTISPAKTRAAAHLSRLRAFGPQLTFVRAGNGKSG